MNEKFFVSEKKTGSWLMIPDLVCVEVMAQAGFDFLVVDMEHTSISFAQAMQMIMTIQAKGVSAFVRLDSNSEVSVKKALDAGADGLICPMINSLSDARKLVDFSCYPPLGKRGVGLYRAQGYGDNFETYVSEHIKKIVLIAQIEHKEAIDHLEEICSVKEIDGFLVGPYDLSASMGYPGEFSRLEIKEAILYILEKAKEYRKPVGFHSVSSSPDQTLEKFHQGCDFMAYGIDYMFMKDCAREGLNKIRSVLK